MLCINSQAKLHLFLFFFFFFFFFYFYGHFLVLFTLKGIWMPMSLASNTETQERRPNRRNRRSWRGERTDIVWTQKRGGS
jgi:hypothetical protein